MIRQPGQGFLALVLFCVIMAITLPYRLVSATIQREQTFKIGAHMLIGEPSLTYSGMTWLQVRHVFEQLSRLETTGLGWGSKQVLQGMSNIEQSPIQLYMCHAHALVGATAAHGLKELLPVTNSRHIESVGTAYHMARAIFCQQAEMLPRTVSELAYNVGMSIQYDKNIPPHALRVVENVLTSMRNGHYKDLHSLRSDLLGYVDGIMASEHSDIMKTVGAQACCFILMHFH